MNKKYKWVLLAVMAVAVGVYGFQQGHRPRVETRAPYKDMVLIPGGTFIMGQSGQDLTFGQTPLTRQATISPFYMDVTEVTNIQYREFVHWVRDSILAHRYLPSYLKEENGQTFVDWNKFRRNSPWDSNDPALKQAVNNMYYPSQDRIFGREELDARLINFSYEWYDLRDAILHRNDTSMVRSDFIRRESLNIYPDTTVWVADFSYAQNEPMLYGYFSHTSFNHYPVVGVSWKQAEAFNAWRTKKFEDSQASNNGKKQVLPFMLPSEAQWEYAARGGKLGMPYPWGGPSPRHGGGLLMANFKPGRGDYGEDGFAYTAPVGSFEPNDFGLYDMAGNVAEWTSTSFSESASVFVHDLNPTYRYDAREDDPEALKRKVIRGGSWKDIGAMMQNSARTYEYQDSSKSYIGFRSVSALSGVQ